MEVAHSMKTTIRPNVYLAIIIISAIVFFIPYLGLVHLFDWDEINFAESAREMLVTGNYHQVQINFQPFAEKPPLFFWLQAASMAWFGVNEFAARFPNAIFGIITLVTFYFIGKKFKSPLFGFIWAISYLGTFLPHIYFKSAIIDPVFNYFIFMGIYFMFLEVQSQNKRWLYLALSAVFIGLGTLTKGPVALLVFLLTFFIYYTFKRFKHFPSIGKIGAYIGIYFLVCLLWFGQEIWNNGFWFLKEFIQVQADLFLKPVASHGEPFYYHFVVVFIGCFPISIIALPFLFRKQSVVSRDFALIMKIIFWTVMILFSLSTTKIVHYSSLTYFPLSCIAALYLTYLIEKNVFMKKWMILLLGLMGLIFSTLLTALPLIASHPEKIIPYLQDPYAVASLGIKVNWSGYEFLIGVVYFIAIIVALVLFFKRRNWIATLSIFYATAIVLFIYLISVVPKIEQYSQGPAIKFYESMQGKDVYIWPVGFRSYAQYFYAKKPIQPVYGEKDEQFLMTGPITKPAYFVIKVTNEEFEQSCVDCQLIKQEGGFKFYKREAVKP